MTSNTRTLLASAATLFGAKAALLGLRVLIVLSVALTGSPAELATVSYVVALVELLRVIADWGLDTWLVRAVAIAPEPQSRAALFQQALRTKLAFSVAVAVLLVAICIQKFSLDQGLAFGLLGATLLASNQVTGLTIAYYQGIHEMQKLARLIVSWAIALTSIAAVIFFDGLPWVALSALSAAEMLLAVSALILLRRDKALVHAGIQKERIWRLLHTSMPIAALNMIVGIYSRIDIILLAQISSSFVAVYTVAQRLFLPFQVAASSVGGAVYAHRAMAIARRSNDVERTERRDLGSTLLVSSLLSLGLWATGELTIRTILTAYLEALPTLRLLCVVLVLNGINSTMTSYMLARGRFASVAGIAAIDLASVITAMTFLLPLHGPFGAAEALLLGGVVNGVLMFLALKSVHRATDR